MFESSRQPSFIQSKHIFKLGLRMPSCVFSCCSCGEISMCFKRHHSLSETPCNMKCHKHLLTQGIPVLSQGRHELQRTRREYSDNFIGGVDLEGAADLE